MEDCCKCSLLRHFCCLLVLVQLLTWVSTQEFQVLGPRDPIVAAPGGEAILPCSLSPAMSVKDMELRWFRRSFSEAIFVYRNQQEQKEEQMAEYSGRTSLVKDQFSQGKAAVRIHPVRVSDSGIYVCFFKQGSFSGEAILELKVAAMGSVPDAYIKGPEDHGVGVACKTSGCYPKPQVQWRDSRGQMLPVSSETHTEDDAGLFSMETSLAVRDSSLGTETCSIFNPILGEEKAKSMFIPAPFFPQVSPWKTAFAVSLSVMGLLVLGAGYFLVRERSARLQVQWERENLQHEKEEMLKIREELKTLEKTWKTMALKTAEEAQRTKEETLKTSVHELRTSDRTNEAVLKMKDQRKAAYMAAWRKAQLYADWRKEQFQAWPVTLDPVSAHPILAISQDRKSVTWKDTRMSFGGLFSVLGSEGISSGRCYWEVKIKNAFWSKWTLGVCREGVERKGVYFESPEKGFWVVGQSITGYWAFADSGRASLSFRTPLHHVGVFVDYREGSISFYNMNDRSYIFSFHKASFSGTLFPYFRLQSGDVTMTISSEGFPVPRSPSPSLEESQGLPGEMLNPEKGLSPDSCVSDSPPGEESPLLSSDSFCPRNLSQPTTSLMERESELEM